MTENAPTPEDNRTLAEYSKDELTTWYVEKITLDFLQGQHKMLGAKTYKDNGQSITESLRKLDYQQLAALYHGVTFLIESLDLLAQTVQMTVVVLHGTNEGETVDTRTAVESLEAALPTLFDDVSGS
jgi:hypothetical protein